MRQSREAFKQNSTYSTSSSMNDNVFNTQQRPSSTSSTGWIVFQNPELLRGYLASRIYSSGQRRWGNARFGLPQNRFGIPKTDACRVWQRSLGLLAGLVFVLFIRLRCCFLRIPSKLKCVLKSNQWGQVPRFGGAAL